MVARGQTNQEIAENLLLSVSTVKKHVRQIISKLGVSDRTQAAIRALESVLRPDQDATLDSFAGAGGRRGVLLVTQRIPHGRRDPSTRHLVLEDHSYSVPSPMPSAPYRRIFVS
jgi:Bacterial regulatory proteins, luxR family